MSCLNVWIKKLLFDFICKKWFRIIYSQSIFPNAVKQWEMLNHPLSRGGGFRYKYGVELDEQETRWLSYGVDFPWEEQKSVNKCNSEVFIWKSGFWTPFFSKHNNLMSVLHFNRFNQTKHRFLLTASLFHLTVSLDLSLSIIQLLTFLSLS